jgi:hypothetical protein
MATFGQKAAKLDARIDRSIERAEQKRQLNGFMD